MAVAWRTRVTVALDSLFAARQLSDAARVEIGVLAEFDAGLGRVGVPPGAALIELAHGIRNLPHLAFEELAFYPGHIATQAATILSRPESRWGQALLPTRQDSHPEKSAKFHAGIDTTAYPPSTRLGTPSADTRRLLRVPPVLCSINCLMAETVASPCCHVSSRAASAS